MIQSLEAHLVGLVSWTHQARATMKPALKQKKPHKAAFFIPSTLNKVLRGL